MGTPQPLLTRALGQEMHQPLQKLQELALLALQETGVAAGRKQAALDADEGAVLAAQQVLQLLFLTLEACQLCLLLGLQGLQPSLQHAVEWGKSTPG